MQQGTFLRIAVGIATAGRPRLLQITIAELARQTRPPDAVIVCAPAGEDVGDVSGCRDVRVVLGARGLTRQRNAILDRAAGFDVVVFFDDDFLPAPPYLRVVEQVFTAHKDVVMLTGSVVADGIIGPGLTFDEARLTLAALSTAEFRSSDMREVANGYGCNMAIRMAPVLSTECRFDDRLPLYGWLEDVDFSLRLARFGRIVKVASAQGVHLGIKQGRQSGMRLGYSQIANPIYLSRKGIFPWSRAVRVMSRNIAANCLRSLRPEPYIDRQGRVAGNVKAFRDLFAGRLSPERILEL
jgi:GT2 family glycosyltransferase